MKHYNEDELARYAFDPNTFEAKSELEQHLADCADCRETVDFIRTLDGALSEETPWDVATDLETAQPLPQSLVELADKIHDEQIHARDRIQPLLDSLDQFRAARIETDPTFQTSGVVRVLADTAETLRQKQPLFALALADAAIAIGMKLKREGALRSTSYLGDAWKERAVALAFIGKYRDAEDACAEADAAYISDPLATEHDRAIVQLVRANFYVESDRLDEAATLTTSAAIKFRAFGDTERYLNARLLEGSIRYMRRDYGGAAAVFEELIPVARKSQYPLILVRALTNAGEARVAMHDYSAATRYFAESIQLWQQLGYQLEIVRANWSLANILLSTGRLTEAIDELSQVHRDFESLGVVNDAALARLQLAEALLVAERSEDVPTLLQDVVVSFSNEGLTRNANLALAYLREAVASDNIEAGLIRDVRLYLEELPFSPERAFTRS